MLGRETKLCFHLRRGEVVRAHQIADHLNTARHVTSSHVKSYPNSSMPKADCSSAKCQVPSAYNLPSNLQLIISKYWHWHWYYSTLYRAVPSRIQQLPILMFSIAINTSSDPTHMIQ